MEKDVFFLYHDFLGPDAAGKVTGKPGPSNAGNISRLERPQRAKKRITPNQLLR